MKKHFSLLVLGCLLMPAGSLWQIAAAQTKTADYTLGGNKVETNAGAVPTSDGGLLVGGSTFSTISGEVTQPSYGATVSGDYWLAKLDAQGNKLWDKRYGGTGDDRMIKIIPAATGGFLLCGWSTSGAGYSKSEPSWGGDDYWVVKVDDQGNQLWDKRYGSAVVDMLMTAVATPDGGCLLTGYAGGTNSAGTPPGGDRTEAISGYSDVWLVKIDAQGNKQWDRCLGSPGGDYVYDAAYCPDGGFVFGALPFVDGGGGGNAPGGDVSEPAKGGADYWIVKINAAGVKQWDHLYGGSSEDYVRAVQVAADGSILVGGNSTSPVGGDKTAYAATKPLWLLKLSAGGVKQWDQVYGNVSYDQLWTMQVAANGDYLLGGTTADGPGIFLPDPMDIRVIRVSPTGAQRWSVPVGGSGDESLTAMVPDYRGGIWLAGTSNSDIGRDKTAVSRGGGDNWLVQLTDAPLATQATLPAAVSASLYPNPVGASAVWLQLVGLQPQPAARVEVLNSLGQTVLRVAAPVQQGSIQQELDCTTLADGLYTVRVQVREGTVEKKMAKY